MTDRDKIEQEAEALIFAGMSRDFQRRYSATPAPNWQHVSTAPKDGTVIWAAFHPAIYPVLRPEREDLERWNGVQVPIRHPGIADDGFDMGWNIAAPVGHGGFPDEWIVGWMPTPPAPGTPAIARREHLPADLEGDK